VGYASLRDRSRDPATDETEETALAENAGGK
jgi:hypothetical protein